MDYDDNKSQGHNRNLAGEENTRSSSDFHHYVALPKFDFDDSLQGHLRFQNLVGDQVLLGLSGPEENQWIEDLSRGIGDTEFAADAEVVLHTAVDSADDNHASVSLASPSKCIAECVHKDGIASANLVEKSLDPPIVGCPDTPPSQNGQQLRIEKEPVDSLQHPGATPDSGGKVQLVLCMQQDDLKEQSFTFEVSSSTGLFEGETTKGWQSYPSVQGHERSTDAKEYPFASDCSQIVTPEVPENSCESPQEPESVSQKARAGAKETSICKTRQNSVKTSANETSGVGKSMMFLDYPWTGHLVQLEEFKPSGNAEQSGSNRCGSLPIPISNLPDLNTLVPPVAYLHQPFTVLQQEQLLAQILVHGSLVQDSVPDEACMVSAFGTSDGGRNSWEPLWHACSERVHSQKSHATNLETPKQSLSGSRDPDHPVKHSSLQRTIPSSAAPSLSDQPIGVNPVPKNRSIVSEDMLNEVETAKIQAENANAHAFAAVGICHDVWSQLAQLKTSGLRSDVEAKLSSAAMAIAAAASVAKAAAAATKLASDVALETKLMACEVTRNYSESTGISLFRALDDLGDIASSSMVGEGKISACSIIATAKERVRKRAEASSAASKHAENMDAKAIAAELAAEAVSQARKIVSIGDSLPLRKLVDSGPLDYWKILQVSCEQDARSRIAESFQPHASIFEIVPTETAKVGETIIAEAVSSGTVTSTEKNSSRTQGATRAVRTLETNTRTISDVLVSGDAPKTLSGKSLESGMTEGCTVEVNAPQEKRAKLGHTAIEATDEDNISRGKPVEIKKHEESRLLPLSTNQKEFNIGKNTTDNKLNVQRTMRSGLQQEGSRVVVGVPKQGKKRNLMGVSKHLDSDQSSSKTSNSIRFSKNLMDQGSGGSNWKNNTNVDIEDKNAAENKPKILRSGKSQSASGRALPQKVKSLVSAKLAETATASQENISSQQNLMEFRSVSVSQDTSEGPSLVSSKGLPKISRKKVPSSNAKSVLMSRRTLAEAGGQLGKKVELQDKSLSQVCETRRSKRKIKPTSRFSEGLQSSPTI